MWVRERGRERDEQTKISNEDHARTKKAIEKVALLWIYQWLKIDLKHAFKEYMNKSGFKTCIWINKIMLIIIRILINDLMLVYVTTEYKFACRVP